MFFKIQKNPKCTSFELLYAHVMSNTGD